MDGGGWSRAASEDGKTLGRELARPQWPAGGHRELVVRPGCEHGAIVRSDHPRTHHPVVVRAVSGHGNHLVTVLQLIETDPVGVVRGNPDHSRLPRPGSA